MVLGVVAEEAGVEEAQDEYQDHAQHQDHDQAAQVQRSPKPITAQHCLHQSQLSVGSTNDSSPVAGAEHAQAAHALGPPALRPAHRARPRPRPRHHIGRPATSATRGGEPGIQLYDYTVLG